MSEFKIPRKCAICERRCNTFGELRQHLDESHPDVWRGVRVPAQESARNPEDRSRSRSRSRSRKTANAQRTSQSSTAVRGGASPECSVQVNARDPLNLMSDAAAQLASTGDRAAKRGRTEDSPPKGSSAAKRRPASPTCGETSTSRSSEMAVLAKKDTESVLPITGPAAGLAANVRALLEQGYAVRRWERSTETFGPDGAVQQKVVESVTLDRPHKK
ncbi:unnamed protein product [Owenia fusiformis]|uniref:C2H2-type domain-containing protein n=1 Tax=Owenia fusiformis TaxID=6347 RepID=A0A8S4Q240_OWEFU|nr:unnamed protein product [Owenia fusiformis]